MKLVLIFDVIINKFVRMHGHMNVKFVDDIFVNPNNAQSMKQSIICVLHQQLSVYFSNTQFVITKILNHLSVKAT